MNKNIYEITISWEEVSDLKGTIKVEANTSEEAEEIAWGKLTEKRGLDDCNTQYIKKEIHNELIKNGND